MPYQMELAAALDAAHRAGRAVAADFGQPVDLRYKSPSQPVTRADLLADAMLRERLLGFDPAAGWLSEETADSAERLGRERVWVVDPIDGTESFVRGVPEFAICVALVEHGAAVVGVVHNPITGETFHAVRGGGARRDGATIEVRGGAPERPELVVSRSERDAGELAALEGRAELHPLGSTSYKLVAVAQGRCDGYLSPRTKGEWDVCAGALIVEEAGGRVSDAAGGALRYNRRDPTAAGVLAATPYAHDAVLRILRGGDDG